MPHAQACAAYHYLSNRIGGVDVEYMAESEKKAWVRFPPPRWVFDGTAICAIPSDVSKAMLRGWYARNGVSLGNPRLGFVCTSQTVDGQHGLSGYFLDYDRDLQPDERLVFRPGEVPPPFDPKAAPSLPEGLWPEERLARASRNYAMEYIRTGLPRLAELLGPLEAAFLGRMTGRLIGAQFYRRIAELVGIDGRDAADFGQLIARLALAEGDVAQISAEADVVRIDRQGWRLAAGWGRQPPELFEAWNGLWEGALLAHNRFLQLRVEAREDLGDGCFVWRIHPAP